MRLPVLCLSQQALDAPSGALQSTAQIFPERVEPDDAQRVSLRGSQRCEACQHIAGCAWGIALRTDAMGVLSCFQRSFGGSGIEVPVRIQAIITDDGNLRALDTPQ